MNSKRNISAPTTIRLSQLATIFQGISPSRNGKISSSEKTSPVINIKNIIKGQINTKDIDTIIIDKRKYIDRYTIHPGDVIITCRGTMLKSAVVPENLDGYLISSNLIAIRLDSTLDPALLCVFLQSRICHKLLLSSARSSTMQIALTVSDIEKIELPIIPLDIQKNLSGLIKATEQYYRHLIESANLRRDISHQIVLKYFMQSNYTSIHSGEVADE